MESVSRINSILGTTHSLTLDAARDAAYLRKTQRNTPLRNAQLKKLLDSRHEREVLEGLRRVIALSHKPPPPTTPLLFSSVLKNIVSTSTHVKKLVYIHLLHFAETDPDTALLSINTIQKTLSSPDPHLRALGLRVMSGIRVPVISQIVMLAIKKGVADMSPLVRKAAALAIPKCNRLDPSMTGQLEEFLSTLLGDKQYFVAGAAVQAYMELFSWSRLDLIHKHYRSLVRKIVDMDDWGQIATLRLMVGYARRCFPRRWKSVRRRDGAEDEKNFYADDPPSPTPEAESNGDDTDTDLTPIIDPDLTLLLRTTQLLLQSRNSAVIVSIARLYLSLAPNSDYMTSCIGPLLALLRAPPSIAETALYNILQVALHTPTSFLGYTTHFLLRTTDSTAIQTLKLELLTLLFPHANRRAQSLILTELSHFCSTPSSTPANESVMRSCVQAIGRCAQSAAPGTTTADRCMGLLLSHISESSAAGIANNTLISESLTVIRHIIQADPASHVSTVTRLAKNLDGMCDSSARASVVWLVGEYAGLNGGDNIAADVLRILINGFADEEESVRKQICLLAAKVYVSWLNAWKAENGSAEPHPSPMKVPDGEGEGKGEGYTPIPGPSYALPEEEGGFRSNPQPSTPTQSTPPRPTPAPPKSPVHPPTAHPIPLLFHHTLTLARYDTSYDLRDRARTYRALLAIPSSTELASLLLLAPKPVPLAPSPSVGRRGFMLGSAGLVVGGGDAGMGLGGEGVPEWVEVGGEPDPHLRDQEGGEKEGAVPRTAGEGLDASAKQGRGVQAGKAKGVGDKSLDDWLGEEDGEESESEESESEDESESEVDGKARDGEEEEETGSEESDSDEEVEDDDEDEDNETGDEKSRPV